MTEGFDGILERRITLCGSTRFKRTFADWNLRLTLAGHIVYSVAICGHAEGVNHSRSEKSRLDAVHMLKILNSDAIFVLDVGGYIGESTEREIAFAELLKKPVYHLSETCPDWVDETGPEDG